MNFITPKNASPNSIRGGYIEADGDRFYRIANSHLMPEFFLVPVSAHDHWMFISSRGALTAGRKNPDTPLFPYYCADKISDMADTAGSVTVIRYRNEDGTEATWEPFAEDLPAQHGLVRNLYKNVLGNRIVLEEVNTKLELTFRYEWTFGNRFGFIRTSQIANHSDKEIELDWLDGIQNIMPYGIDQYVQMRFSNLGSAYKKNELLAESNVGIYYLSSILTDRAEPSEGLRGTVVWQTGLTRPKTLLSSIQLDRYRAGLEIETETDIRARRGAYLVNSHGKIAPGESTSWKIIADVCYDQTDVANLSHEITDTPDMAKLVCEDASENQTDLKKILASSDGLQLGADRLETHRHLSNVLFNVMRGGYPEKGYRIKTAEFADHLQTINKKVFEQFKPTLDSMEPEISLKELIAALEDQDNSDLLRIGLEYLPFSFSRRHGDPSRPWNAFSIELTNPDGSKSQNYQGNWRDIFQNWEALSFSYPLYTPSMIFRFVNASTADGYNPYRVTKDGFDWESPEPDDPWANIGYWGDHQIVYLLKLLEASRGFMPKLLDRWLSKECCAYANVPYRIKSYEHLVQDAQDTIEFDRELELAIMERTESWGSDGKLLPNAAGDIYQVTLGEKLLLPALVKMTNFVPEGGIWLNTQRPEWNDANNALVGNGLSMVTVYHLRRFFRFMSDWFSTLPLEGSISVSKEVVRMLNRMMEVLRENEHLLSKSMSDKDRRSIVDALSTIGSDYRINLYKLGFSTGKEDLPLTAFVEFFEQSLNFIDHTIKANRREDGLYHSYNLLALSEGTARVDYLYEMLEGQVAVLNSAALPPEQAVEVLEALRSSKMYREDQQSYMLYPDRNLARFTDKNVIANHWKSDSKLIEALISCGDESVIKVDCLGGLHFNGDFRNASDLNAALTVLGAEFQGFVEEERQLLLNIFEETFVHRDFTGRSGTFFGYEGLGSIYWHMVSKLRLAAMENLVWAHQEPATERKTLDRLHELYREIREGIGVKKSPEVYGAMPVDPYSHTPAHAGAQQPGMTGQVKEDVIARFMEFGLRPNEGTLSFDPRFFETTEFVSDVLAFDYIDASGNEQKLQLEKGQFAFTVCQVPIVFQTADSPLVKIHRTDGGVTTRDELSVSESETAELYSRAGAIQRIEVYFPTN